MPWWLAVVVVVGTSGAVLVLEILAARLLAPYVGVTLETYAGIIGTVLAGIAVGAWLGGVAADRFDPWRLIPVLLVAGGALAIATVPTIRVVGSAVPATAFGSLILAALGFLPSATVLSAVPPAVVKLQLRDLSRTGATVGRLSAYGTAGAIVATFLTGFVLVAVAAVSTIIISVGALLVLSGLALWLALPARQRRAAPAVLTSITVIVGVSAVAATTTSGQCDAETTYYCVVIEPGDSPTAEVLVLDNLRHSYIDRADPTYLAFWYSRRFAEVVEHLAPEGPLGVIHAGGGALTVPAYLQATRADARQIVFEIDADLIDLVIDRFDRVTGPGTGLEVVAGDARVLLGEEPDESVDVFFGDAFGSRAVPWHLATREFMLEVDRVLRPDGIYALNVIDGADLAFLKAEVATAATVFGYVAVVLSAGPANGGRGNSVIIASNRPFDAGQIDPDGGQLVIDIDEFADGAMVLSDDFAPVDQLLRPST